MHWGSPSHQGVQYSSVVIHDLDDLEVPPWIGNRHLHVGLETFNGWWRDLLVKLLFDMLCWIHNFSNFMVLLLV